MEEIKADVEKRFSKVLKFVQSKNKNSRDSKKELIALVKDLHEQCQALYLVFDELKEVSGAKTRSRKGKSDDTSSTSSSDSEYYSSEEIDYNTSNNNNHLGENPSTKEELETANLAIADLKHRLTIATEEKEALNLEYNATLDKLQQAEVINKNLRNEVKEKEVKLTEQIKELEVQSKNKEEEAKQLGENNDALNSQIAELELISKEKEDRILNITKKFGDNEKSLTSQVEDLTAQVDKLKLEVDFLHAQNGELAGSMIGKRNEELDQFKHLMDQVNITQQELALVQSQKKEMAHLLDMKNKEVTQTQSRLKCLEEENRELRRQVQNLDHELGSLREQNNELEDQLRRKIAELGLLKNEKSQLESQIEKEKHCYSQSLSEMRDGNPKVSEEIEGQQRILKEQEESIQRLTNKVKEQQRLLKEQKDTIEKLTEDQKIIKRWSFGSTRDSKLNVNLLERKMEELAELFRMKMEDHIRILNRRIHVAEQIHIEHKNNYRKARETNGTENGEPQGIHETQFAQIKDMLQLGCNPPASYDSAIKKLEETENFVPRMSKLVNDIKLAMNWVSDRNNKVEQLKHEAETLVAQLECKEAQESLLKEKLSKLEARLGEEGAEKLTLTKVFMKLEMKVRDLEVENVQKDEELLRLGEEKREAIKQLCILMDYQRGRFDQLKEMILKKTVKA